MTESDLRPSRTDVDTVHKVIWKIHRALKGYNNGERMVLVLTYLDCMLDDEKPEMVWAYVQALIETHQDDGIAWGKLMPDGEYHGHIVRLVMAAMSGEDNATS